MGQIGTDPSLSAEKQADKTGQAHLSEGVLTEKKFYEHVVISIS